MKKCDIRGCKKKAETFTKSFGFCKDHWKQLIAEYWERGMDKVKKLEAEGKITL